MHAAPKLSLCHGIFTDRSILRLLFPRNRSDLAYMSPLLKTPSLLLIPNLYPHPTTLSLQKALHECQMMAYLLLAAAKIQLVTETTTGL